MRLINGVKVFSELDTVPEGTTGPRVYSIDKDKHMYVIYEDDNGTKIIGEKFGFLISDAGKRHAGSLLIVNRTLYVLCADVLVNQWFEEVQKHWDEFDNIVNTWGTNISKKLKYVHNYFVKHGKHIYTFTDGSDGGWWWGNETLTKILEKITVEDYEDLTVDNINIRRNDENKICMKRKEKIFNEDLTQDDIYYMVLLYGKIRVGNRIYHKANCFANAVVYTVIE